MRSKLIVFGAVVAATGIASPVLLHAGTMSSWVSPISGLWTDSTRWSTPHYPANGSPPGTTYDAVIDFDGAPDTVYTITLDQFLTLDSLTLDSPRTTLRHLSWLMQPNGTLTIGAGTLAMENARISGGLITSNGDGLIKAVNGLNILTDVSVQAMMSVLGGGTLWLAGNSSILSGSDIKFESGNSGLLRIEGASVVPAGATVRTGTGGGVIEGFGLHNAGTLSARTPGYGIYSGVQNLSNTGTIEVLNGSGLQLAETWHNDGTMVLGNGTLVLSGSYRASDIGTIVRVPGTAGTLQIGTSGDSPFEGLDNHNQTLALNSSVGPWYVRGRIAGGTISSAVTPNLVFDGGTLDGVTMNGAFAQPVRSIVKLANDIKFGLTQWTINSDGQGTLSSQLVSFGNTTVSSSLAEIVFDGAGGVGQFSGFAGGTITTLGGVRVRTGTGSGLVGRMINHGTISSETAGQGITVVSYFSNMGFVEARNGGTVLFNGLGSLSNYTRGVGGATLTGGKWNVFAGSTMSFGASTITTNSADIRLDGAGSTWDALAPLATNHGRFSLTDGRTFVTQAGLANTGTLVVRSGSVLRISGELVNSGTIDLRAALVVDYSTTTSPLAALTAQIRTGYAQGAWDGPGVHSTGARFNNAAALGIIEATDFHAIFGPDALFAGQSTDDSAILIGYTYAGDTDLNGVINFDDYARVDAGFNNSRTGWINGTSTTTAS